MPIRVLFLRLIFAMAAAISAPEVLAHPIDCTPRYSDSHCVTPISTGVTPPPTCPSAPGYSTITPAVWAGYKWSQPVCSDYQAPPSCPPGDIQTGPTWNGVSWVGLSCVMPATHDPVSTCLSAASSGNIMVQSIWVPNRRYVAASQFTQIVSFFQVTSGGPVQNWTWPTYTLAEYQGNYIQAAVSYLQLPLTAKYTNTWYAATYTGPSFMNDIGNPYNGYITMCSIDASGNLAGIVQMPAAPSTSLND